MRGAAATVVGESVTRLLSGVQRKPAFMSSRPRVSTRKYCILYSTSLERRNEFRVGPYTLAGEKQVLVPSCA